MVAIPQASNSPQDLHVAFLSLVPKIETHARITFAYFKCPDYRADKIAESVALAWKWFLRLHDRGKNALEFPMAFAVLVTRAVASGRRLAGADTLNDVMSKVAQWKHGFSVAMFILSDSHTQETTDTVEDRLAENTQTPVPDQAAFRVDFPEWMQTLPSRERSLVKAMMREERTNDLSRDFGLSPSRISQLRSELRNSWTSFCGDAA